MAKRLPSFTLSRSA
jgi:hypothetical protein